MKIRYVAIVLSGLLSGPAVSHAGEIPTPVTISTQQTPGQPSPGTLIMTFDPSGTLELSPGVPLQIGTVTLGPSPGLGNATDSFNTFTNANVSVRVTDAASGWTGTLQMPVVAVDNWNLSTWDGTWQENQYLELGNAWVGKPASTSVILQGWQYTLTATPNGDVNAATFTLTTAPVHTPEPGTLLLGLAGLAPVGFRTLRRRK